ncbi:DUF655 domain-containing protein [Lutispora thermophila]|uniref:Competence protein ComEA n=1 Tax=Lutispora thermophila DSM 19022 TaxID=1122184 RepID=A0A1M6DAW1_9FIRM|nr:DUF655 domain-containing protein [Lutispora thermophila]SHI70295.1 competence protein ComEA [Lutispora thermophila DSM 19022]
MYSKKEKVLICIIIILALALIGNVYINSHKPTEISLESNEYEDAKKDEDEIKRTQQESELIGVHISGAVKNPGFIWIKEGTRLGEALNYVGGALVDADLDAVNLSKKLSDEEKVYIPRIGENIEKAEILSGNGKTSVNSSFNDGKININTAGIDELDSLPGIGEAYAKRIIEYREANGPFKSIEDIKNVSGIGAKRYEAIKDLIKVK